MEKLTKQQVEHIADLANISLTSNEVKLFQDQLTSVIEYNMDLLNEVDVEGVPPTAQTTGLENIWRQDEVGSSLDQEITLGQAPNHSQNQFKVKRVLGES